MTTAVRPWLRAPAPVPGARARLLCFPCAGSGSMMYHPWRPLLPADLELWQVQPPGREDRTSEPPLTHVSQMVDALLPELRPLLDKPVLFFGHSMGALLAYTLTLRLREEGLPLPRHLFLSARPAPQRGHRGPTRHILDDAALLDVLRELGGTPEAAFSVPGLVESLLPLVRADFTVSETYRHTPVPPLDVPVSVFGGLADRLVPTEALEDWRECTRDRFSLRLFPGGHFYLHDALEQIVQVIADEHAATGSRQSAGSVR
ncbi:thioesterase II family protein [Streptomyces sp. NPDC087294]|uniref:thioesterase II family protein n=1 Tax=Streptomyces sp. NPDC087294 TaxID=3365777 RepID=UPI003823D45D